MPFYEIESWAFANTSHLRRILVDQADIAALTSWEADLARLDEIEHIKHSLTIRDAHNAELVQLENGFPVATLADTPGSYAATLDRLRRSELVTQGLGDAAGRPF
jgi:cell wall assembly regulator SMI1